MPARHFLVPALASLMLANACSRTAEPERRPAATVEKSPPPLAAATSASAALSSAGPSHHLSDLPEVAVPHPPSDNAKTIRASQILIAFKGAKGADPKVTRNREEAKALAEHVDIEARAGADFSALVAKYSDDPQARTTHGDLGALTRESLEKPLTDAAFGLMKQEIGYEPVETSLGFHIIKRTE